MTVTKLDMNDNSQVEGRACVVIYNIGGKELKSIQRYASLLGVRDQIVLYPKNADTVMKDILENNIKSDCTDGRKERAIIFNALSPAKINVFLENLRKLKINNVLKATVTETSINWTLNEIVANLSAERMAISQGNFDAHH